MTCDHFRRKVHKRAKDGYETPKWENAIIEECLDCGAFLLDVKGRRFVHDEDGRREVEAF